MKSGKTLVELAQTLTTIRETSKDYLVPIERVTMETEDVPHSYDKTPVLSFPVNGHNAKLEPTSWAHQQIALYSDIPQGYYDRIRSENPTLLADSVNHGFAMSATGGKGTRMVRTYDNKVRAFLSSRYRRLDSYDLLEVVLPQLIENRFEVISSEITEQRMYISAKTERITGEIKAGDPVQYGITISTSDVGAGALRVEPLIYRLVCTNGLITSNALRKYHLGKNQAVEGDVFELLTDETKNLSDQAFWLQVRDLVAHTMKQDVFNGEIAKLRIAAEKKITNYDIPEVVELASRSIRVTNDSVKKDVVAYLANGADGAGLTQWGLINGFTYAAQQDNVGYDDSIDLTRKAGAILELSDKEWKTISESKVA